MQEGKFCLSLSRSQSSYCDFYAKLAEKTRMGTQSGGRFIDTLIGQWMSRTGSNISLQQTEEVRLAGKNFTLLFLLSSLVSNDNFSQFNWILTCRIIFTIF